MMSGEERREERGERREERGAGGRGEFRKFQESLSIRGACACVNIKFENWIMLVGINQGNLINPQF